MLGRSKNQSELGKIGAPCMASLWSRGFAHSSNFLLLPPLVLLILLFSSVCPNSQYLLFLNSFPSISTNIDSSSTENLTVPAAKLQDKSYLDRVEGDLARAREAIQRAVKLKKVTAYDDEGTGFVPRGPIYRNPYVFHQSHIEMVKRFKVWTYREGEPPLVHGGPFTDIYSIEGHFIHEMENNTKFMARRPEEAHAFFLPFTVVGIVQYVYNEDPIDYSRDRLQNITLDYVNLVSHKYPFWNRSLGADHFMASCHDWGPEVSFADPKRLENMVRVLCNANTSEGFRPNRDVSLPDIYLGYGDLGPTYPDYGPNNRPIFAFFSGGAHGEIRETLFQCWKGKDSEIQVYEYLKEGQNYKQMMRQSKFCLCPSGFEVACPRPMESIYAGCVPVILSINYTLPFSDVLDWSKFSVQVPVDKIPELKTILKQISYEEYLRLQKRVIRVRRHFRLHRPAKPFDIIHMALHSVWLRRLNFRISP